MSDMISREAAIEALLEKGQSSRRYKIGEIWELNFDEMREALNSLPPAEPKAVPGIRRGYWEEYTRIVIPHPYNHYEQAWKCSECGYDEGFLAWNYCPKCGAKMEE